MMIMGNTKIKIRI